MLLALAGMQGLPREAQALLEGFKAALSQQSSAAAFAATGPSPFTGANAAPKFAAAGPGQEPGQAQPAQ